MTSMLLEIWELFLLSWPTKMFSILLMIKRIILKNFTLLTFVGGSSLVSAAEAGCLRFLGGILTNLLLRAKATSWRAIIISNFRFELVDDSQLSINKT